MSLYLKQIEQLISLQKVDDEIHHIRQELEGAPKELENLRERFAAVTANLELQQDKMSHLRDQEKRLNTEMEDDSARMKKSKGKLMAAGNSKEYQAMVREMDSMERMSRNREDEQKALQDELQRQTSLLSEVEAEHLALKNELTSCETSLQERVTKAQNALDGLMGKRSETGKDIPQPVFVRYEFIRERLKHPVIVPVQDGVCSGCNISIPPQNYIELQKAAHILSCPNCQRLMFWDKHFTAQEEEK